MTLVQPGGEVGSDEVNALVDHLFRHHAGRMVATLTRILGSENLSLAEDVVQDALVQALRTWPYGGIPHNPQAWLIQVARNRALDRLRRAAHAQQREDDIRAGIGMLPARAQAELAKLEHVAESALADDVLIMLFMCCHPGLPHDARLPLTLKTVCGLAVPEIARALLLRDDAVAQRIVRAKRRIRDAGIAFEHPAARDLAARRAAVLEVLYLMFNEGHSAHVGADVVRHELCNEAVRLAQLVADDPHTAAPEADALLALFLLQAARFPARTDAAGRLVLLSEQDRSQWDRRLLGAGLHYLARSARGKALTRYHIEAEIAAIHSGAARWEDTDWARILELYDDLLELQPTAVVAVHRAVAVWMVHGPAVALATLEALRSAPELANYLPFHATLAELLATSARDGDAAASFRRALELSASAPVLQHLSERLAGATGAP